MDKRLLNFMLVSMLLFVGYMEVLKLVRGPQPPAGDQVAEQAPAGNAEQPIAPLPNALGDQGENDDSGESEPEGAVPQADGNEGGQEADGQEAANEEVADPAENKRLAIGSVDPTSGYPMLVTFNSKGGAVERIELSDPKYRDLYDKTAYIGHLGLVPTGSGFEVTVVGGGTPAAKAGIQVGDVITSVGDESVTNDASVSDALANFKFGQEVPVQITRNGASQSLTLKSVRRPLEVVRPEGMPNGLPGMQQLSYLTTIRQIGVRQAEYGEDEIKGLPSLHESDWYASATESDGDQVVEFRFPLSASNLKKIGITGEFEVVKRFTLRPSEGEPKSWRNLNYHFDFELEFVNQGSDQLELSYRLDGPTGLPLEGWWYSYKTLPTWGSAGVRDVIWRAQGGNHQWHANPEITKRLKKNPESPNKVFVETSTPLEYVGVDAQYFNTSLLATNDDTATSVMFDRVDARALSPADEKRATRTPITYRADSSTLIMASGETAKQSFHVFAGPKHPEVLDDYALDKCIVYGWFSVPAKVMGWLLHKLHFVFRNYGIAIILLTVIVRACMIPIGRQQAMNAKKMQELTPEIKKIKEKYPNDTEKQAKAQQELFSKHNYNPIAGCLPMFLQLPLFIGLYRALSVDIELRQTPLLPGLPWCENLAGPDMLLRWDSLIPIEALTGYTGYLGPYLNLLPMISTGFFLLHQQMFTPPPTDEQQEMQQKVMKFMMLFMLVMFFKVPAGLCLYFITSSMWALGERMLLPKDAGKKDDSTPVSLAAVSSGSGDSGSGNNASGKAAAAAVAKKKRRKRSKK